MRLAGWVAVLALAGLIFAQSYAGRVGLWESQSAGCERGKLDRAANAESWRTQALADWTVAHDSKQPAESRQARLLASRLHLRTAKSLERRARIDCARAFPKPSPLP